MNKRNRFIITLTALLAAICIMCSGCISMVLLPLDEAGSEEQEYSEEALLTFLHGMLDSGESSASIRFSREFGEELAPVVDDAIYNLHDSDFALSRFAEEISWDTYNRWGCVLLEVDMTFAGDYTPELLEEYCPGYKLSAYDADDFTAKLDAAVRAQSDELKFVVKADDGVAALIDRKLDRLYTEDCLCSYYVDIFNYDHTEYGNGLEVTIGIEYVADRVPYEQIPLAEDELSAAECMIEAWSAGKEYATFRINESGWTHDTLFAISSAAEANSAELACECDYVYCNLFPRNAAERIVEVWLTFTVDEDVLNGYDDALKEALDVAENRIRNKDISGEEELYLAVHDAVVDSCEYDEEIADATLSDSLTPMMHAQRSAYGVFVDGRSVCTGYARAFKALCDRFDLPCWVVYGEQDGVGHAWNMVKLYGETLYVDCTFDDTGGGTDYFMITERRLKQERYIIDEGYLMPEL